MIDEPLDTDQHYPAVLDREDALDRITDLLPADLASTVWNEIISPLYDARTLTIGWSGGHCRRCHAVHPALWNARPGYGKPGALWPGHKPYCPKYVGPVEHSVAGGHQGPIGWRNLCSCGESWNERDADGNRRTECPKAAEAWRGPQPVGGAS